MSSEKYIGLDVHQATISVAVMDSQGKVVISRAFRKRPWKRRSNQLILQHRKPQGSVFSKSTCVEVGKLQRKRNWFILTQP